MFNKLMIISIPRLNIYTNLFQLIYSKVIDLYEMLYLSLMLLIFTNIHYLNKRSLTDTMRSGGILITLILSGFFLLRIVHCTCITALVKTRLITIAPINHHVKIISRTLHDTPNVSCDAHFIILHCDRISSKRNREKKTNTNKCNTL